jgi:RluA family pseudouridine synthase
MKKPLFSLVYEDTHIAAVDKSSGIAVSPDRWDLSRERLDKLVEESLGIQKIYTVHRIDRETSGLVVFAKNSVAHKTLSMAFENRQIKKRYIAVACGRPSWKETVCDLALVPNGNKKHLTIIDRFRGKNALTSFRLLGSAGNYSVLEALPATGRIHQIRVHLVALGHPVVCDELYGNVKPVLLSAIKRSWRGDLLDERPLLSRLGLHAAELFIPDYAEKGAEAAGLALKAPLARDMSALIRQMEKVAGEEFLHEYNN